MWGFACFNSTDAEAADIASIIPVRRRRGRFSVSSEPRDLPWASSLGLLSCDLGLPSCDLVRCADSVALRGWASVVGVGSTAAIVPLVRGE